jgi:DNA-binding NarL/FixJ family response regulator
MQALTRKQQQVCELVALGWSNKEIAAKLGVDTRTIETHRANIYDRMGVRNAVELVRKLLGATV